MNSSPTSDSRTIRHTQRGQYLLYLLFLWMLWILALAIHLGVTWQAYQNPVPEAAAYGASVHVCPSLQGYSPCTFWQFYLIYFFGHVWPLSKVYHSDLLMYLLLVTASFLLLLTFMQLVSLLFMRARKS